MRAFLLALLLVPGLGFCQSSTPAYWRFAPSDPALLIGVDWRQASQSGLSGLAPRSMTALPAGLEFADEIGTLLLSAEPGVKTGKERFLAIVSGKFNEAKLRAAAAAEGVKPVRCRGVDLFSSGGTDVAVVEGWVLLAGDGASVRAAIERGAEAQPRESSIWRRAAGLSTAYTIWIASDSLQELQSAAPAGSLFTQVSSIDGGIALQRGMEMAFDLTTPSEASAGALAAAIQAALADGPQSVLRDLAVRPEGAIVKVSAALDAGKVEAGLKEMLAGGVTESRSLMDWMRQSGSHARGVAQAPPPPQRKTIRIVGLEEGTREIPYPPPQP